MSVRPPAPAPQIDGFEVIRLIGTGGFADVHLYQQLRPRREVAIKVLSIADVSAADADAFTAEANHMAQVDHPAIVRIYGTDVARDGRPYIVMEHFAGGTLADRLRRERLSESEVLEIGVAVAGAVETAHRAGILHRDIKPANILLNRARRVALTDFGIAVADGSVSEGMSVPWAPPEAFASPPTGDARSDVYSLAATLYTLLAQRPPYQVPGGRNGVVDVIQRTKSAALPPIGRSDVSADLGAVLATAMAKDPADRYESALAFGRELQKVQIRLGLRESSLDVVDDDADVVVDRSDSEDATHFRGVVDIDPEREATRTRMTPPRPDLEPAAATTRRTHDDTVRRADPVRIAAPTAPTVADTVRRPASEPQRETPTYEATPPRRRRGLIVGLAAAAAVVAAIAIAVSTLFPSAQAGSAPTGAATPSGVDLDGDLGVVPQVTALTGLAGADGVVFTWTNPDPQDGDTYRWRPVVTGQEFTYQTTDQPTATVPAGADGHGCIDVLLVRADGRSAAAGAEACS